MHAHRYCNWYTWLLLLNLSVCSCPPNCAAEVISSLYNRASAISQPLLIETYACSQALAGSISSKLATAQCEQFLSPLCSSVGSTMANPISCKFMCESALQSAESCPAAGQACAPTYQNVSQTLLCPFDVDDEAKKGDTHVTLSILTSPCARCRLIGMAILNHQGTTL